MQGNDYLKESSECLGSGYRWSPRDMDHIYCCNKTIPRGLFKKKYWRTSLVAQWLRICLPMQGTGVRSGKIPHAAEQLSPCATTTEPARPRAHTPQVLSPCATTTEAHTLQGPCTATTEPACYNY